MKSLAKTFIASLIVSLPALTEAAPVTRSIGGDGTPASIQATIDLFRADLGGVLNPNVVGSFPSGRREINWDGVPDALASPNNLPLNFFNVNSPRGAVFTTPGTSVGVSANGAIGPVRFGDLNATYPSLFSTFSAQRLFTPIGSNIVDVQFFVPGSTNPAATSGFGAVFTDVDLANTTSIQYFDVNNVSLGTFFAPVDVVADGGLSFLGVSFGANIVSRVRITNGNASLGPNETAAIDLVVMDDFLYGEPQRVPEPGTLVLLGVAIIGWRFGKPRRIAG